MRRAGALRADVSLDDPAAVTVPTPLSLGIRSLRQAILARELPDQGLGAVIPPVRRVDIVRRRAYSYCHGSKGEGGTLRRSSIRTWLVVGTVFVYSTNRDLSTLEPPGVRPCEKVGCTPLQTDDLGANELAITITPACLGVHHPQMSLEPAPAGEARAPALALLGAPEPLQAPISIVANETVSAGQAESSPITAIGVSAGALNITVTDTIPESSRFTV